MKNVYQKLAEAIINGAVKATAYLSENHTIKFTRRLYGKKTVRKGSPVEMVVTEGRPNYAERQFIKLAKKAGVPFPIKKIQLKY